MPGTPDALVAAEPIEHVPPRTAADLLAELVDIDRPASEGAIIEREFAVLRHAFDGRVAGEFRRNVVLTTTAPAPMSERGAGRSDRHR